MLDVLVIGGGNAALCAALMAREAGASVLVLESAPREWRGGNSVHTRNLRCIGITADGRPRLHSATQTAVHRVHQHGQRVDLSDHVGLALGPRKGALQGAAQTVRTGRQDQRQTGQLRHAHSFT